MRNHFFTQKPFYIQQLKNIKTCSTKYGQGHALVGTLYLLIGIEISTLTWPIFCSVFLTYIIYCIDLSVLGLTCDMRYFRSFLQHVRSFSCWMQDLQLWYASSQLLHGIQFPDWGWNPGLLQTEPLPLNHWGHPSSVFYSATHVPTPRCNCKINEKSLRKEDLCKKVHIMFSFC